MPRQRTAIGARGQHRSSTLRGRLALAALPMLMATAGPAHADFCLQLDGGPFSGDLGFFRFRGDVPTTAGKIATLRGRVAGLGPVFGTGVVAKDGSYVEIGATFFVDAEQGQVDLVLSPPGGRSGSGDGDYGAYGTAASFSVLKVSCQNEPAARHRTGRKHEKRQ